MHVPEGRDQILMNPGVVRVLHAVLGAHLADLGRNVGVPRAAHAREEVVLHLEVEPAREVPGHGAAVGGGGLHLGFEPAVD